MNELRAKIAELLRYEHTATLLQINPAFASIEAYLPIADAILDIERDYEQVRNNQNCETCKARFLA